MRCVKDLAEPSRTLQVGAPVDGVLEIAFSQAPELQREGGSLVLVPQSHRTGRFPPAALVVAGRDGRFLAYNAECTHANCFVTWKAADEEIECPCHGSRFASDGRVVYPPARGDLAVFPASGDGQRVQVQIYPGDGTYPPLTGGAVTLQVADYPSLQADGGVVEGKAAGYPDPIIVVRIQGSFQVLSAVCPHLGCTVLPSGGGFLCPCDQSKFTLGGGFISGPAQSNLVALPVSRPKA